MLIVTNLPRPNLSLNLLFNSRRCVTTPSCLTCLQAISWDLAEPKPTLKQFLSGSLKFETVNQL